jgi:rhodanese-related sulfurtransferase
MTVQNNMATGDLETWPNDPVVIDVRSPAEYASGYVAGALNLPLGELANSIRAAVPRLDQGIVLHCQAGMRAANALQQLQQLGYTQVVNGKTPGAVALRLGKPIEKSI